MTKEETKILKGVAILLMIFSHLFYQRSNVELCSYILRIGDVPFICYLTRAANPVPFFLILSGYGMYKVYQIGDKHRFSRIFSLLSHHWVILFLMICLMEFLKHSTLKIKEIILNAITLSHTLNGVYWFLFPYIVLTLISPLIFKICDNFRTRWVLITFLFIYLCTSYGISRFGTEFLYNNELLYDFYLIPHISFSFMIGAMAARCEIFSMFSEVKPHIAFVLLLLLIAIQCCLPTGAFNPLYSFLFIFLFLKQRRLKWCDKILVFLGGVSMDMWLIHNWFCYYLFHDWIYGFKYPIIIFMVLLVCSVASAMAVRWIISGLGRGWNLVLSIAR